MGKSSSKAVKFAKEHNIYVNEAERVLKGELTLEDAEKIRDEFLDYLKSGVVQFTSNKDNDYLYECLQFKK